MSVLARSAKASPSKAKASKPAFTLATMCIATFIAILDTSVVNLALKSIQSGLHAGLPQLQWIVDSYNLVYASFILTGGILGDLYGRRKIFAAGIGVFTAGSLACAAAPSAGLLIAARSVAGLGAALQLPSALAILNVTYPNADERGRAIGIWAGFNGLAMAVGPTVGGLLVDRFGWRSVFLLVVPFGVAILVMTFAWVRDSSDPKGRRLDRSGQVLAAAALATVAFVFIEAPSLGWGSPVVVGAGAVGVAAAVLFLRHERATRGGMVPLSFFRNAAFTGSLGGAVCMTFAMYGFLFLFPMYLQTVRNRSAVQAGLELLPMSLLTFAASPVAGRLMKPVGARILVAVGMALGCVGFVATSLLGLESPYLLSVPGLAAIGLGLGTLGGPLMTVAVSNAPRAKSGISSGLFNVGRMVGATIGVAIVGTIFGGNIEQAAKDASRFLAGMRLELRIGAGALALGAAMALSFFRKESGAGAKAGAGE